MICGVASALILAFAVAPRICTKLSGCGGLRTLTHELIADSGIMIRHVKKALSSSIRRCDVKPTTLSKALCGYLMRRTLLHGVEQINHEDQVHLCRPGRG